MIARGRMQRLSDLYGKLLQALAYCACAVLFAMMLMICADVLLRNVALVPDVNGLPWSNEITENMLYLITMLAAPYLLRQGQHIRVDIVLRMLPKRVAWYCEWACDVLAFGCCAAETMRQTVNCFSASRGSCASSTSRPAMVMASMIAGRSALVSR